MNLPAGLLEIIYADLPWTSRDKSERRYWTCPHSTTVLNGSFLKNGRARARAWII